MESALLHKDYNQALKENRLLGLTCRACSKAFTPPQLHCPYCESTDLAVTEFKGTGKIRTYTSLFVGATDREKDVPYIILLVELDEGPWVMGNLESVDPKEASFDLVGKQVKLTGFHVSASDLYSHAENAGPLFTLV